MIEPLKEPSKNLTDWLVWAYWEMRNNYYTGDNKLAETILHDALVKLERAWELSRMEKAQQLKGS